MARKLIAVLSLILTLHGSAAFASNNVTVFAASSLTESFTELGKRFQRANPESDISFSFQASSTLANQIKSGAPADIFISASKEDMQGIATGRNYLINRVVLGLPRSSKLKSISDLNNRNYVWIQCALVVPCGAAADKALQSEGIKSKPSSYELKASNVISKLLAKEVDAAVIYRTDAIAYKKQIKALEFTDRSAATTQYKIALLTKGQLAQNFYTFLQSKVALKYLASKGFESK